MYINYPGTCFPILQIPHQPLVLRFDLEDLHRPLLPSVESFGFLAAPLGLVLLGRGVAQYQRLVTQYALYILLCVRQNAVLQECPGEGPRFRGGLRLETRQWHRGHLQRSESADSTLKILTTWLKTAQEITHGLVTLYSTSCDHWALSAYLNTKNLHQFPRNRGTNKSFCSKDTNKTSITQNLVKKSENSEKSCS